MLARLLIEFQATHWVPLRRHVMFGFHKPKKTQASAFETLTMPHMDALYSAGLRLTRNPKDAEDLVQDTYLKAFRFFDSFEQGTNVKAWLFKIQMNTFINKYRRKVREREVLDVPAEELVSDRLISAQHIEASQDPEGNFFDQLLSDHVVKALEQVPVDFRMVVLLSDLQGFAYKEIAEILECPVGTVMSRLFRGRRILQKQLYAYAISEGILKVDHDEVGEAIDLETYRQQKKARRASA